jgi:ABC-type branched-subunit amino acid transport system substrate-binding protein
VSSARATTRRAAVIGASVALCLMVSACGTRLAGTGLAQAEGAGPAGGTAALSGTAGRSGGATASGSGGSTGRGTTATTSHGGSGGGATFTGTPGTSSGAGGAGGSAASGGTEPSQGSGGGGAGGPAGSSGGGSSGSGGGGSSGSGGAGGGSGSGSSGGGYGMPPGGNGGATATGVTANSITIANIASISGVAPGLTQSAQQATVAFADYVNSLGGVYGRDLKVVSYDDANDSGQNYSDASQACTSAFALVGSASGFDDGSANAVSSCGIPDLSAEVSTAAAGETADIFGASPGNAHYWPIGPAEYLKSQYPNAVTHAAMIYLNVPATQTQAAHEMAAYQSVGFKYVYTAAVSPTEPNYAPYVLAMQQAGVQYVTEYSDDYSAERLLQAMQQQDWHPQVVDWFSEEYTPSFVQQVGSFADGDLVLMSTSAYEEASGNPGMQLFESWMNRVAPGYTHDIFAEFAWSAGLAFLQALRDAGPHLTRAGLIAQLKRVDNWTGGGLTPPEGIGSKTPSGCFSYFKIENGGFARVYPSQPNTFDCQYGLYRY